MPKVVDHDERRQTVVSLTAKLIADEGIGAVSFKGIAEAAGSSTAIISHYFENKRELLHQTYRMLLGRSQQEQHAVLANPANGVMELAEALLPLRSEQLSAWRISVEFFSEALVDTEIRMEWENNLKFSANCLREMFLRMAYAGHLAENIEPTEAAEEMLALIRGIGTEMAVLPHRWPEDRQRTAINRMLQRLAKR
jgi:TetR/AcrR family transcriptional repressor of bet genes